MFVIDWGHIARHPRVHPWVAAEILERLDPLSAYAKQLGIAIEEGFGVGKIQLEIFEKTVEEKLRAPCFITAYRCATFTTKGLPSAHLRCHSAGVMRLGFTGLCTAASTACSASYKSA